MHVLPSKGGGGVCAVATVGNEVFILRNDSQQVEVYDALPSSAFTSQRQITVRGLGDFRSGLAACAKNDCLYLSDWDNSSIHRVQLSVRSSDAMKKWSVSGRSWGLSVNSSQNVVVACCGANSLQEYTTHGTLVREISLLQAGIGPAQHAVELSGGDYVAVSYKGVISVVGVNGQVQCRYAQSPGNSGSRRLIVTKNDKILVTDEPNNRILSLNSSLSSVQELALSVSVDGGIQGPVGLCLDESRGRLYVGESDGDNRVLVFDGVNL